MAKVYTIEPNPHWVIIDNFSKLPNGAAIYTYSNKNPSVFKPAFEDDAGDTPYGEYIQGFGNGTMPPIFWEFDDAAPDEGYYIRVYDRPKDQPGANFLWDFNNLFGGGTGGGGTVISFVDLENLVVNGEFYNNCGNLSSTTTLQTIAPSNHAGFDGLANSVNDAPPASDIVFAKSNTSATDSISFVNFTPGSTDFSPNPTPEFYVNYKCVVAGNEAYKVFQFPLVTGLQNTSGQVVGGKLFIRLNSGTNDVNLRFRQFYGNGGAPSADVDTIITGGPLPLNLGDWVEFEFSNEVIPVINANIGSARNDALFLQISLPQGVIDVDFILPAVYLGGVPSDINFHTQDEVEAITNSPRTGDVRNTLNGVNLGWVRMNDKTIGNPSSNATAKASFDTFPLFKLIWDNFNTNPTLAPMFTSGGAAVAYGADAVADFTANRQISLTKNLGRVMIGALPEAANQSFTRAANTLVVTSTAGFYTGMEVTVSGGGLPSPLVAGTIYYAVVLTDTTLSLATSTANAIASTPTVINLTTAGSGTIVSVNSEILGAFSGEEAHVLDVTQMPPHTHTEPNTYARWLDGAATVGNVGATADLERFALDIHTTGGAGSTSSSGLGAAAVAHNTMQPYIGMNVFIKL